MKRISTFLLTTALLSAGPAMAQVFEEWDADSDGILSEEEWDTGFIDSGVFDEWDTDDDDVVGAAEFGTGLFTRFDDDNDGALTVSEWDTAFDAWYGERAVNLSVENWDDDGDGVITEAEFQEEYTTTGVYSEFTAETGVEFGEEAGLAEEDLGGGLFDWFDADDDTGIVADEEGWFG